MKKLSHSGELTSHGHVAGMKELELAQVCWLFLALQHASEVALSWLCAFDSVIEEQGAH